MIGLVFSCMLYVSKYHFEGCERLTASEDRALFSSSKKLLVKSLVV